MMNIGLPPQEFVTVLALYNFMPTSISSGVSLTKLAGGISSLALAITELSNLLFVTVLIPLITGKVLQISRSRPLLLMVNPEVVLMAVIMGAVLHIVLLCLNSIWVQILCSRSGVNKSSFANKDVAMGKEAKIQRRIWDPRIKIFLDNTLREGGFEGVESVTPLV
ncbi:probable sodium/metabolite cotransporter BASS4, chloroplastic [Tanacetum coccineum]